MRDFKDIDSPKTRIKRLTLSDDKKLSIMSDMHRGDGTGSNDFAQNSLVYKCALDYYMENGFIYIELGDAEELWENKNFDQLYITHTSVYEMLAQFHHLNSEMMRYIKIWGNQDLKWRNDPSGLAGLFPGTRVCEVALLENRLLMWHGHKADPSCLGSRATVAKFFVGGIWTGIQRLGMKDPPGPLTIPAGPIRRITNCINGQPKMKRGYRSSLRGTPIAWSSKTSLTEKWLLHLGIGIPRIERPSPDPAYH